MTQLTAWCGTMRPLFNASRFIRQDQLHIYVHLWASTI